MHSAKSDKDEGGGGQNQLLITFEASQGYRRPHEKIQTSENRSSSYNSAMDFSCWVVGNI